MQIEWSLEGSMEPVDLKGVSRSRSNYIFADAQPSLDPSIRRATPLMLRIFDGLILGFEWSLIAVEVMLTPPQSEDMRPGQGEGCWPAAGDAEAVHGAGGGAAARGEARGAAGGAASALPGAHPEERPDSEKVDELEARHEAEAYEQAGQAAQGACGTVEYEQQTFQSTLSRYNRLSPER